MGRRYPVSLYSHVKQKLTSSLIAHPKDRVSTLQDVQTLPFFQKTKFSALRETTAPFVPMLDGETDVGYFDSFESAEDMAKYAEVFKKQRDVEAVQEKGLGNRNNWVRLSSSVILFIKRNAYNRLDSLLERTQLRLELLSSRLLSSPRVRLYRLCSRPSSTLILVVCFVYFQCSAFCI
jgi:hypothetical protein